MKRSHFTPAITAMSALLVMAACSVEPVTAPQADVVSPQELQAAETHIFVLTNEEAPSQDLIREIEINRGELVREFDNFGVLTVRGLSDDDARSLSLRNDVEAVSRDMIIQWSPGIDESVVESVEGPSAESDQSDAFYYAQGMQWNIEQIKADEAWTQSGQGDGTTVAVLDTGVDPFHLDLSGKITASSASALSPGSSPCGPVDEDEIYDLNFHGTFVSGLISSNGIALGSVAPDAEIMGVKVLNCTGSGSFADIIAGIVYATDAGADAINMSLGAYFSKRAPGGFGLVMALARAVGYAHNQGTLVVASAGNDGIDLDNDGDFIHVPSELPAVISVGATAPIAQMDFDMLASYTNYGGSGVDIQAPGGDLTADGICGFAPIYRCDLVLSAFTSFIAPGTNWYVLASGTSFASPLVAGVGAVQISSGHDGGPQALTNCILKGADDLGPMGIDPLYAHGRLNVLGALACE